MSLFYSKKLDNGATIWLWKIDGSSSCKQPRKREQEAVKCLLNQVLNKDVLLCHHENGRPYLENCNLQISISHTSLFAAVIAHSSFNVGIDIENLSRNFSVVEKKALGSKEKLDLHPTDTNLSLAIYWSAKEAVYKRVSQPGTDFANQIFVKKFDPLNCTQLEALFTDNQGRVSEFQLGCEVIDNHIMVWTVGE